MMAEIAEWPDEIDKNRAMKAEERARRRLEAMEADLDYARAEIALRKALVRLDITEK
jgi:F-type H+-transporting ATPase subunit epsilon